MWKELYEYYRLKWQETIDNTSLIAASIYNDTSTNFRIIRYPFMGIKECFGTMRYGYLMFVIFLNYMVSFLTVGLVYFYLLFPLSFLYYTLFLGPAGLIFAVGHGIAFCNAFACHEARISSRYFMNMIYVLSQNKKGKVPRIEYTAGSSGKNDGKPISRTVSVIAYLAKVAFLLLKMVLWYAISLTPIIGLVLFKIQSSPSRGFAYFLPYFKSTGKLGDKQLKHMYYSAYGQWLMFGLITGLLEAIPILAGFAICTNTCGCALWEAESCEGRGRK